MRWPLLAMAALLLLGSMGAAQGPEPPEPDLGPLGQAVDEAAGTVVPPLLEAGGDIAGEDLDREDIQVRIDMDFTKGDVNLLGFLIGSGRTEIEAQIDVRLAMRVISSDRLRAVATGENVYNVSAENTTFLSTVYMPADVFRASLAGEAFREFQDRQEEALQKYLKRTLPELELDNLEVEWSNTSPGQVPEDDGSVYDPPILLDMTANVRYVRVDSLEGLLRAYLDREEPSPRRQFIRELKADAGDPLRSRDFFSAAAYTQMLNLTAQPGWTIDVNLTLPAGYEFTYFNREVLQEGPREASLHLDALDRQQAEHKVFLASITHKRAVALTLFVMTWAVGLLLAAPARWLYLRRRLEPEGPEGRARGWVARLRRRA